MNNGFRQALRHDGDCPPPEELIEAVEHSATSSGQGLGHEAIVAHAKTCPACQTELALFREFETGAVKPDEREAVDFIVRRLRGEADAPVVHARPPAPSLWVPSIWGRLAGYLTPVRMGGFAVAMAALLLTFGVSTQWRLRQALTERGAGSAAGTEIMRSETIRGIVPTGEVAEFPAEIRWNAVAGAAEYDVTLLEVDQNVIFHKTFTTPVLLVPSGVRKLIVQGKTVLLQITAADASGRPVARSGSTRIHVSAGHSQNNGRN